MRVLIDIAHPTHVHFFRHITAGLHAAGHQTTIVARDKEVTLDLLRALDMPHQVVGRAGAKGRLRQGFELLRRDVALVRIVRSFGADVILTRNPAGVQAARLSRTTGVFDTVDGSAVGIHFKAARPFAHLITTPDSLDEDYGRRHVRYPSLTALAYLHPSRFTPDPSIRRAMGLGRDEPYSLLRFSAFGASHDRAEAGLSLTMKRELVASLARRGRVFISSESPLAPEFEAYRFPVRPEQIHDVLAHATVVVGDSGSVAAEAAVLGVPSLRLSSFAGRLHYLEELEHRYGLAYMFGPSQFPDLTARLGELLDRSDLAEEWGRRRARLLEDKCDLTAWYLDFVQGLA